MDPVTSVELDHLILSLAHSLKITFIVVTHELPSIFTIADRVIMLDKEEKGIIATGSPQDLRDHSDRAACAPVFFPGSAAGELAGSGAAREIRSHTAAK